MRMMNLGALASRSTLTEDMFAKLGPATRSPGSAGHSIQGQEGKAEIHVGGTSRSSVRPCFQF